jgi:hypothetical protein
VQHHGLEVKQQWPIHKFYCWVNTANDPPTSEDCTYATKFAPPDPFHRGVGLDDLDREIPSAWLDAAPWRVLAENLTGSNRKDERLVSLRPEYRGSFMVPAEGGATSPRRSEWLKKLRGQSLHHLTAPSCRLQC